MPAARGENIVKSVPRSRCTLSWPLAIDYTDFIVGYCRAGRRRLAGLVRFDLLAAPCLVLARGGGVVTEW
jgi:hypothetical protein